MSKTKLEYIWLDGYKPTANLRSKTKIVEKFGGKLSDCPMWSFDGSSTQQAEGGSSDCLLKPVAVYPDPVRKNAFLVMTEVLNADGSPHESNGRATIDDDDNDFWFGLSKNIFYGILKQICHLDSRKTRLLKGNFIVPLVVKILSEEMLWTSI
jgi:glutamine synthetase